MSIKLNRYVNITSGVGAGAAIAQRQLIGRFFSDNHLIPSGGQVQFSQLSDVLAYFGSTSEEYKRALQWFGWISKNVRNAQAISFARWVDADQAPEIYGAPGVQSLANWTPITAGAFNLSLGGVNHLISGLNFSGAVSLAGVAALIQTAIRLQTGTMWTAATVSYDAVRGCFNLVGGLTGAAAVSVTTGGGGDIAGLLGWLSPSAIFSAGAVTQTITQVLDASANANNNFGSFAFMRNLNLNLAQVTEAATWNKAQNVMFMYSVPVIAANASTWNAALALIGGCTTTLDTVIDGAYPEQMPMMIAAATDYSAVNSTQDYMYQNFPGMPATVLTDTDANTYDALGINYYGQTQSAGQLTQFYQRGTMYGGPADPLDQNTYVNEIWLKDAMSASLVTLLLALSKVSANITGQSQVLAIMDSIIQQAKRNGTISAGKTIPTAQQQAITQATNDPNAWRQVQNIGYWVTAQVVPYVESAVTKYKIVYTLIYSKDDVIRLIQGTDVLI